MMWYGLAWPPLAIAVAVAEMLTDGTPNILAKYVGTLAVSVTWIAFADVWVP